MRKFIFSDEKVISGQPQVINQDGLKIVEKSLKREDAEHVHFQFKLQDGTPRVSITVTAGINETYETPVNVALANAFIKVCQKGKDGLDFSEFYGAELQVEPSEEFVKDMVRAERSTGKRPKRRNMDSPQFINLASAFSNTFCSIGYTIEYSPEFEKELRERVKPSI